MHTVKYSYWYQLPCYFYTWTCACVNVYYTRAYVGMCGCCFYAHARNWNFHRGIL